MTFAVESRRRNLSRVNFPLDSGLETNFVRPDLVQSRPKYAKPERTAAVVRFERGNPSKRVSRCYHVVVKTRFIYIGSRGKAKGETINGLQVKRVKCDLVALIR